MSRKPNFTKGEIERVLAAGQKIGMTSPVPVLMRYPDGRCELTLRPGDKEEALSPNEWDRFLDLD